MRRTSTHAVLLVGVVVAVLAQIRFDRHSVSPPVLGRKAIASQLISTSDVPQQQSAFAPVPALPLSEQEPLVPVPAVPGTLNRTSSLASTAIYPPVPPQIENAVTSAAPALPIASSVSLAAPAAVTGPASSKPTAQQPAPGQTTPNASGTSAPAGQYTDHVILAGETLSSIASARGVSVATIMANNPGVSDFDIIHPGQTLRIPTTNGILYDVRQGDTVAAIGERFGVASSALQKLPANGLQNADAIHPGQTILVPVAVKPPAPPVTLSTPLIVASTPPKPLSVPRQPPAATASTQASAPPAEAAAPPPAPPPPPAPVPAAPPAAVVSRFIWPIQGPITQGFGVPELGVGAPHTGIDIGLYGRDGTPIAAAAAGTVVFSGGDACCSYGYYVILSHPGGLTTLYGHLSRRAVSVGQTVTQGQTIGFAGSTGFSTGTHLHFEVHLNGQLVNPLNYLP